MTILQDPKMGLYHGNSSLYAGRRGIYAGPKRQGGGFSPLQLPGFAEWWSPRDASTITMVDTDKISQIEAQNAILGHDLVQVTVSQRPTYPAIIGGVNGFQCGATDRHLESAQVATASEGTAWCIFKPHALSNDGVFGNGSTGSGDPGIRFDIRSDGTFLVYVGDSVDRSFINLSDAPDITYSANDVLIGMLVWNGVDMTLRVNGMSHTKAAAQDPSRTGNFALGSVNASFLAELDGVISDAGLFSVALSAEQQNELEAWAAAIHGVFLQ